MKIIGHRGARGLAPENTVAGLKKAVGHHVDMIEFDVRVTHDAIPVLHHNAEVIDPNGNKYKINKYSYRELREHKPDLPRLKEALEAVGQQVPLYIEVKPREPVAPIVQVIKECIAQGMRPGHLSLASKDQKALLELHAALPDIQKIVIEPWSGVRARVRARQVGTNVVAMNQLWLWRGFIRAASRGERTLYAYTLNNPQKARRWAKYGLAGVITDYPDRFEDK